MPDRETIVIAAVLFFATLIRSAFGFGEALVAVPLLALVIPVEVASPIAVLASITVAGIIVVEDWRRIHFTSAVWLTLSTFAGIPIGLYMLKHAPDVAVRTTLGCVIVGFSLYSLLARNQGELHDDRLAPLFGFAAGVFGGAYGMNGPPLALFGSLRRWPPAHFRATLQGYFFPASAAGMFAYWRAGLWTHNVTHAWLWSLPSIVVATLAGRIVNRRLDARRFGVIVHGLLVVIGSVLLIQVLVRV